MKKTLLSFGIGGALALSPTSSLASTFTFQSTNGTWQDSNNWRDEQNNPGVPDSDDKAIIPSGKLCKVSSGLTQEAKILEISSGGTVQIINNGQLKLYGDSTVDSKIDGSLQFITSSCPASCGSPPSPGVLYINDDLTIEKSSSAGLSALIEGGCGTGCLNPGRITGPNGVVLTLENGALGSLYIEGSVEIAVETTLVGAVNFKIDTANQLMKFSKPITGTAMINIYTGKLQVDAPLKMTGAGGFDFGNANGDPEIEINAVTCQEGNAGFDDGTFDANADFQALGFFHIGPQYFEGGDCCENDGPMVFEVAAGVNVSFPGTGGTCP